MAMIKYTVTPLVISVLLFPFWKTLQAGDPFSFMLPNFLLIMGSREWAHAQWKRTLSYEGRSATEMEHIPVLDASEYSVEALQKVTNNWRSPALIKGLFNNTPALKTWTQDGVLADRIGEFDIPVMLEGRGNLRPRVVMPLKEAISEVLTNKNSRKYVFFPNTSRRDFSGVETDELLDRVRQVIVEDLHVDKILKPGFATETHKAYSRSQLIIGRGTDSEETTTGTTWHCAIGNNWFIQAAGGKRWLFMDPQYSAYMLPLLGGRAHMISVMENMTYYQQFLPIKYADLQAGDLLYNPDWQWHHILNNEGVSIGVPVRELILKNAFRNNFQYSLLVVINKVVDLLGLDIRGYPLVHSNGGPTASDHDD